MSEALEIAPAAAPPPRARPKRSIFAVHLLPAQYPALHGLRAIVISMVIAYHVRPQYGWVWRRLWFFMDMFFVLSGFLIGHILLTGFEKQRGGLLRFYLRRTIRIFPAYYFVLFVAVAVFGLTPGQRETFWREVLYLTNYKVAEYVMSWSWSLSIEEHFYIVIPLIIIAVKKLETHRARIIALSLLWLSGLGVRIAVMKASTHLTLEQFRTEIFFPTHCRYDELVAGILLAYVAHFFPERVKAFFASPVWPKVVLLVSGAMFVILFRERSEVLIDTPGLRWSLVLCLGTLPSLAYPIVFMHLIHVPSLIADFLGQRFFIYYATFSYSMYLVHLLVLRHLVRPLLLHWRLPTAQSMSLRGWLLEALSTILVSAVCGYLIHLVVDKPMLALRDRTLK